MNGGTLGGGVVIALAAVLWLAYLLPTWLRRRDYLNAERNAVRLQQTLRILAETAEVPQEVRIEATAREVARQQRLLKKARAKADAAARAHAASEARAAARLTAQASVEPARSTRAAAPDPRVPDAAVGVVEVAGVVEESMVNADAARTDASGGREREPRPRTVGREQRERAFAHAVRRTRLATLGVIVAALVGIGFGLYSTVTAGSWVLLAASGVLFLCATLVLRRAAQQVAAHRAARRSRVAVVRESPELYDHVVQAETTDAAIDEEGERSDPSWAPRPLPKPMYQSPGSRAAAAMASLDAAVALRRAAAREELEERAARIAASQLPTIPAMPAPEPHRAEPAPRAWPAAAATASVATSSRYARMGVLDDVPSERIDLDEALRRRRAVG